ncbi:YfbM family protein [Paenibacillus sp. BC26]|uniref:YfbM family protein n=1 Tax=Paenibacillus sp. BC26 TaxID=1881032 RepID=UPI0008ED76B4|nr:YfbM family protein [Paenibacillus sp. BC26]SFT15807.1 protein of unknown function [Paenibacillus sp. BC26]
MSMVANLQRISSELLHDLLQGGVELEAVIYSDEGKENESLYLDKSWHAIHYLLNGAAWEGTEPLVHTVLGGTPIGGETDEEDQPTRYLTVEQVKQIHAALVIISEEELIRRYNPEQMRKLDLYPSLEWDDDGDREYVMDYYQELVDYYRLAAASDQAMLLYIS